MRGYTSREVTSMLGLTAAQVRAFVRSGFLQPQRGDRGELRFTFQDLVLLRTARGLLEAQVPPRRLQRALRQLRERLPDGRPLTGVHIHADGKSVVIREGEALIHPESGQRVFDFRVEEIAQEVASLVDAADRKAKAKPDPAPPRAPRTFEGLDAAGWFERGCELEDVAPDQAMAAYRRAVELDPMHAEAHVNLGRLLHDGGDPASAEDHYRRGLEARPDDVIAAFNLGVALEDLARPEEAIAAYERALESDPALADAHFNLARLHQRLGHRTAAIRHLQDYKRLTR